MLFTGLTDTWTAMKNIDTFLFVQWWDIVGTVIEGTQPMRSCCTERVTHYPLNMSSGSTWSIRSSHLTRDFFLLRTWIKYNSTTREYTIIDLLIADLSNGYTLWKNRSLFCVWIFRSISITHIDRVLLLMDPYSRSYNLMDLICWIRLLWCSIDAEIEHDNRGWFVDNYSLSNHHYWLTQSYNNAFVRHIIFHLHQIRNACQDYPLWTMLQLCTFT